MLVDVGHFWGVDKIGEISLPFDKKIDLSFSGAFFLDLSTDQLTEKINVKKHKDRKYLGVGY